MKNEAPGVLPLARLRHDLEGMGYGNVPTLSELLEMADFGQLPHVRKERMGWAYEIAQLEEIAKSLGLSSGGKYSGLSETVSYNLPVEMIEEIAELAALRLKLDKQKKRAARLRGEKPTQARRSASAAVREALEAHRPEIQKEIEILKEVVGFA